jgi:hypothetical protein
VKLFERKGRRLSLTGAGHVFVQEAGKSLAAFEKRNWQPEELLVVKAARSSSVSRARLVCPWFPDYSRSWLSGIPTSRFFFVNGERSPAASAASELDRRWAHVHTARS